MKTSTLAFYDGAKADDRHNCFFFILTDEMQGDIINFIVGRALYHISTSSFIVGETSRSRLIKNLEHWLKHAGTCIKGGKFKREEGDSNKKLKVLLFDSNFLRILIYE